MLWIEGQSSTLGRRRPPAGAQLAIRMLRHRAGAPWHTLSFHERGGHRPPSAADPEQCASGGRPFVARLERRAPGTGDARETSVRSRGPGTIVGNLRNTAGTISPGDQFAFCSPWRGGPYTFRPDQGSRVTTSKDPARDARKSGRLVTGRPGARAKIATCFLLGGAAAINGHAGGSFKRVPRSGRPPASFYQVAHCIEHRPGGSPRSDGDAPVRPYNAPYAPTQYAPMYNRGGQSTVEVMKVPNLTVKVAGKGWGDVDDRSRWNRLQCPARAWRPFSPLADRHADRHPPARAVHSSRPPLFVGWSGGGCHGTGRCTFGRWTADKSVTRHVHPTPGRRDARFGLNGSHGQRALSRGSAVCSKAARLKLDGKAVTEVGLAHGGSSQAVHLQLPPVTRKGRSARGPNGPTLVITPPDGRPDGAPARTPRDDSD